MVARRAVLPQAAAAVCAGGVPAVPAHRGCRRLRPRQPHPLLRPLPANRPDPRGARDPGAGRFVRGPAPGGLPRARVWTVGYARDRSGTPSAARPGTGATPANGPGRDRDVATGTAGGQLPEGSEATHW